MFSTSKNFSLQMVLAEGPRTKERQVVGGEPFPAFNWEGLRYRPQQPLKMSRGFKESRQAAHPQRPVSQESRGPGGPDTSLERSHLGPI